MTGTIPGVFRGIPCQRAAQVGTAFHRGLQQMDNRFKRVDRQLWAKDGPRLRENLRIGILLSLNQIAQDHCRNHGRRHAPFVKAGGYK